MRRALILLALPLLMAGAPAATAASADGWQQATPENARPAPPQLRSSDNPTPRPDPGVGWQQASNATPRNASPPPQLRSDAPLPTPRPDPRGYGPMKASFPGGVTGTFDIAYQTLKGFRPLTLDLYQPQPRNYPLPLVVFVHGGGFGGGDSRHAAVFDDLPATMAGLASQGYVVASINYRLSGEAHFPAAVQDIKAAIRFLRGHANEMGLDTTRAALWGVSTGGQLAALAGVSCGVPLFAPTGTNDQSDCVQAVVDWYGPVDTPTAELLGCEPAACLPGVARTASPITYIGVTSPPFLIEHGAADKQVAPADAQKLAATLKASNVAAELVMWPNVGQDFAGPGGPDPATTRQALQRMAAFLANVFPPGAIGAKARSPRGPVYQ